MQQMQAATTKEGNLQSAKAYPVLQVLVG